MKYWHVLDDGKNGLARMVLDIISAPGTSCATNTTGPSYRILTLFRAAASVDVERAFSWGGLTVLKLRHNLSDESTRAATVLGAWTKVPGLVPESDVVEVFRNKRKRGKGTPAASGSQSEVMVVDSD